MNDLKIKKDQNSINLVYKSDDDWLEEKIANNEDFRIYHTFNFVKEDVVNRIETSNGEI